MKFTALLCDTRTQVSKAYVYEIGSQESREVQDFLWTEGNYACDCNRSLFFYNHDPHQSLPCNLWDNNLIELKSLKDETGHEWLRET